MLRAIMTTFHIIGSKIMRTLRFVLTYSLAFLTVFVSRAADAHGEINVDQPNSPIVVNITRYPYNTDVDGNDMPVEIGRFSVPAVRGAINDDAKVEVGYVRYPSNLGESAPPIVFLTDNNTPSAEHQALYSEMTAFGDVIVFNRRGYGLSATLPPCSERIAYPLDEPLEQVALANVTRQHKTRCLRHLEASGVHINAYTDIQVALDLVDLARVLEAEQITLIAENALTLPVLQMMQTHADMLASVILVNLPENAASYESAVFEILGRTITPDSDGALNPAAALDKVLESLRSEPKTVEVQSRTGRNVQLTIGEVDLAFTVVQSLIGFGAEPDRLIGALRAATNLHYQELAELMLLERMRLGQPESVKLIRAMHSSDFHAAKGLSPFDYAAAWPGDLIPIGTTVDELQQAKNHMHGPVLIVNGRLDLYSASPLSANWPEWSDVGDVIEVPGEGRDVLISSPAVRPLIHRFVNGEYIRPYTIID